MRVSVEYTALVTGLLNTFTGILLVKLEMTVIKNIHIAARVHDAIYMMCSTYIWRELRNLI